VIVHPKSELPPLLRAIHDPPERLFVRGGADPDLLSRRPSRSSVRLGVRAGRPAESVPLTGAQPHRCGLCVATVVVEAREKSGALIIADFALDEGREVFAVPGEITSRLSDGTNALLRLGATPLTSAADVLEVLGIALPEPSPPDVGDVAARLLEQLPASFDELVRASSLETSQVAAALAELELAGLAAENDGVYRASLVSRPPP
jgi:predicted Rossmann fold nucleotide-binding protein DprA/Smf involved in DNA uptake